MIRRGSIALALAAVVGCGGGEAVVGTTDDGSTSTGTAGASSGAAGQPCPLVGAYVDCTLDGEAGRKYCDVIDGSMQWGPCLPDRACELVDSPGPCSYCALIDGVPTLVSETDCGDTFGDPECPECHPAEECACADACWCQCPGGSGRGVTCPDGTELCSNDEYPCCEHGGLCQFTCDVWAQDCEAGEKCMPWGSQEEGRWKGSACVPVAPDPKGIGEACTAAMGGFGGADDCGPGAMCWGVDQSTDQGWCAALCTGDENAPMCPDTTTDCVRLDGVVNVCAPACDPLVQDCPAGNVCVANVTRKFVCAADLSGPDGFISDTCRSWTGCKPGLACVDGEKVVACHGPDCCAPYCSVAAQDCPTPLIEVGATCVPYPSGVPQPGYEDVGVCMFP